MGGVSHTQGVVFTPHFYIYFYFVYIYILFVILSEGHRTGGALQQFDRMNLKQCCRSFPAEQKKKKRRPNTNKGKKNSKLCLLFVGCQSFVVFVLRCVWGACCYYF